MTLRLVVIDDNPNYLLLVRYALAGTEVELVGEAPTAEEGIEVVRRLQPDVVLVDIVMEPISGLLAVQPLREAAPDAVVVAVSSYAEHELWGRSAQVASVLYLSKAVPPSRLAGEVERMAAARPSGRETIDERRARFPPHLRSAGEARRFVADVLTRWDLGALVDSASLLVSELVTNAVIHAHSEVELVVRLGPDLVRVEVLDAAVDGVHRRAASADAQSGRGMALIEALASSWGIDRLMSGKSVWFEVPRPAAVAR